MNKVNLGLILIIGLLLLGVSQLADDKLHITVCDVGQGDAILISWKNYQMLMDGGPDNSVLNCLGKQMGFWDRTIELVVLSHPQADHMTGLIEVLDRYEVKKMLVSNVVNDTEEFWRLRELVIAEKVEIFEPVQNQRLKLGPRGRGARQVEFEVLWPAEKGGNNLAWKGEGNEKREKVLGIKSSNSDVNEISVVLQGKFGKFDFLLTGDIGKQIEKMLMVLDMIEEVELLKIAHHGSKYSSDKQFLEMIKPEIAVISVGKNSFGHPTEEVLGLLEEVGAEILRTDEVGMVEIVSDGESWWTK